MRYLFHLFAGLTLILIRSAIMPCFFLSTDCYDLLIPFVLHLSIFCPVPESLAIIAILGFLTDSMSSGAFGLCMTSYVWIFLGMRRLSSLIRISGNLVLSALTALGVLIQDGIALGMFAFSGNGGDLPDNAFPTLFVRLIWAMATGGLVTAALEYARNKWNQQARNPMTGAKR